MENESNLDSVNKDIKKRDNSLRKIYAEKAISQIPRLISLQDRSPLSPSYGSFHRDYWLDKTSDFPDAVRQFGVQSLALVYKNEMPGNIFYSKKIIKDWAIAGLRFWAKIQHKDGSFDEFYPNERGWVGPTAFTSFTSIEAYKILKDEMRDEDRSLLENAFRRAANFIIKGESEEDHLANHHAMACLATWKSYEVLGDSNLKEGYEKLWEGFLSYHNSKEGWSTEYDGIDPGYLSATVSFLSKIYQSNPASEILDVVKQSIDSCSYFVYPNGFYAGSMGSRNTLHFYSHGFEVFAKEIPLAGSIAEKMLLALSENKLVPPEIISDRYVFYRVPEYLQSYIDYYEETDYLPPLPYEKEKLSKYFELSKIWVHSDPKKYIIANLAKGGVVKAFDKISGELIINDCGLIGQLENNKTVTTQWIDLKYRFQTTEYGWNVEGSFNIVPTNKYFTILKNIIFRTTLLFIGLYPKLAHSLKGWIRKILMLGNRPININFKRSFKINEKNIQIKDSVNNMSGVQFSRMIIGGEFFVRYVPQSRYFQSQELNINGYELDPNEIDEFNKNKKWKRSTTIEF